MWFAAFSAHSTWTLAFSAHSRWTILVGCNMMANSKQLNVGSRKSELALIQTRHVIKELTMVHPPLKCEVVTMDTLGDRLHNVALSKIGETGLFAKALESALAQKAVDCVVHSLKDLPTSMSPYLAIGAITKRSSKFDAVVFHPKHNTCSLKELPEGSVVGTSSLRRTAQLQQEFPGLNFEVVRGSLNERLKKLDEGNKYDALVLAEAGILRMNWQKRIGQVLDANCLYAAGQGAIAVEIRADEPEVASLVAHLNDFDTLVCCVAERGFVNELGIGYSIPIGVSADYKNNMLHFCGGIYSTDGLTTMKQQLSAVLQPPTADTDQFTVTAFGVVVKTTWLEATLRADGIGREVARKLKVIGFDYLRNKASSTVVNGNGSKPNGKGCTRK